MRLIFMGTPDFAVPSLEACVESGHEVVLVVTQPARPRGRGRKLAPSPVRQRAETLGLPVLESERVNRPEHVAELRRAAPDLACVTAFGQILSAEVLSVPTQGCVNVHASLLPRWRGAAPIHHAIIAGDRETGVTLQFMAQKMDAGDIILQKRTAIGPTETQQELAERLSTMGGELLGQTIALFDRGTVPRTPQDESAITFAPMLSKDDGRVDWACSPEQICNLMRGTIPWPGAFAFHDEKRVRLWAAKPLSSDASEKGSPGELVEISTEGIVVGTGSGPLVLSEVQPESKRRMPASDWARGARLQVGDRLT